MTAITFTPNNSQTPPFSALITMDGVQYTLAITWNVFGQRWYTNLYALDGTLVFCKALVGSPNAVTVESAVWADGYVAITTSAPHNFRIGTEAQITIIGCAPGVLNGTILCSVTGPDTFIFPLAADPGPATALGTAGFVTNIAAGYFQASTLAYYEGSQQLVVTP
jgi:hypothetical protein